MFGNTSNKVETIFTGLNLLQLYFLVTANGLIQARDVKDQIKINSFFGWTIGLLIVLVCLNDIIPHIGEMKLACKRSYKKCTKKKAAPI